MCDRANNRVAFGKPLAEHQQIQKFIFDSAAEIQASRLLTLHAAQKIDQGDEERIEIGLIKVYGADEVHIQNTGGQILRRYANGEGFDIGLR